jgi:hypothetical protein
LDEGGFWFSIIKSGLPKGQADALEQIVIQAAENGKSYRINVLI